MNRSSRQGRNGGGGHPSHQGRQPPYAGQPYYEQTQPYIPPQVVNRAIEVVPNPELPPAFPPDLAQKHSAAPFGFGMRTPEYRPINPPLVVVAFTDAALEQARVLVGISANEVGWWGTVREVNVEHENVRVYLIEAMYLVEQTVEPGYNTLKGQGKSKLVLEWKAELGDMRLVQERYNRLWAWCHSHGNGDTEPSIPDDNQWNLIRSESKHPVSIRLIFNRLGQVRADVDLIPEKLRILDVQCMRLNSGTSALEEELRARYKKLVTVAHYGNGQNGVVRTANAPQPAVTDAAFGTQIVTGSGNSFFCPDEGKFHD